ncbi:hypothetical protein VAR608DRAFT_0567 [Variovorax sp. HW608]|uniref:hypothetical protein n=1 Tax=Variovorax sp. HW608 TaxID=1034889 RepID=UPI00081FB71B|nr:hypothetical protein [Variovorax sp. HW608]SCK11322.1 hypothetical protein VAR608DRAFT_0567 [Variovorax sp. HW608]
MRQDRSSFVKLAAAGLVAVSALTVAVCANAGASWSVGIAAPGVAIGVAEPAPPIYYAPAPGYSPSAHVYYQPAPVYRHPAPPVAYVPGRAYYEPYRSEGRGFYRAEWDGGHRWDRRDGYRREWEHERYEGRRGWGDRD